MRRIYVMCIDVFTPQPLWHVSVDGTPGEDHASQAKAIDAARRHAHALRARGEEIDLRVQDTDGQWRLVPWQASAH